MLLCPNCNNRLIYDTYTNTAKQLCGLYRCNKCGYQEDLGATIQSTPYAYVDSSPTYTIDTGIAPLNTTAAINECKEYTDNAVKKVIDKFDKLTSSDNLLKKLDVFKSKLLDLASFIDEIIEEELDDEE